MVAKKEALFYLRQMMQIRQFEDMIMELLGKNIAEGGSHLYAGEEAIAVGAMAAIKKDDYITSTHRGHGHCVAKGGKLDELMAEILGKATGCCKGKGGSLHLADLSTANLGANGIVGGGLGIATGAALSVKMRNSGQVVLCFIGDGATNQGLFHECANMAAVWKLPIVFICENNFYGMSVSVQRASGTTDFTRRALAYGMPSEEGDGMAVLQVRDIVAKWVEYARSGKGPVFLEFKSYRYYGHSRSDPRNYRTREEEKQWADKDCIKRFSKEMTDQKVLTEKEVKDTENEVKAEIDAATKFAIDSPDPKPEALYEDLYA